MEIFFATGSCVACAYIDCHLLVNINEQKGEQCLVINYFKSYIIYIYYSYIVASNK